MAFPYKLIIFDCDGVLVHLGEVETGVRDLLMREQGIVVDPDKLNLLLYGMTNEQIFATLNATYGMQITPDFEERYISLCHKSFETAATAIEGSREAVSRVHAAGVPKCVASNGPHAQMQITLRVTGHQPYFEGRVFSAYDVPNPKPAPDLFLHAAKTLGVPPAHCVVIEDSRGGVQAALDAGMSALHYMGAGIVEPVTHPRVTPFPSMAELPRLLGLE